MALDQTWSSRVCLQQAAASGDVMNSLRTMMCVAKNTFFAPEPKSSPNLFPHLCPSSNAGSSRYCIAELMDNNPRGPRVVVINLSAQFPLGYLHLHSVH